MATETFDTETFNRKTPLHNMFNTSPVIALFEGTWDWDETIVPGQIHLIWMEGSRCFKLTLAKRKGEYTWDLRTIERKNENGWSREFNKTKSDSHMDDSGIRTLGDFHEFLQTMHIALSKYL